MSDYSSKKRKVDNRSESQILFDYSRNVMSTIITLSSVALIFYSIGAGLAALEGPPPVLYIVLIVILTLLGYLEGLQVAILALERIDSEPWKHKTRAYNNHALSVANNGLNVQRFLVGRQFFVVFVVFVIANLTTYKELKIDFMPKWMFIAIIDTGLPGALVVLAFGQLMPQLVASSHPITFMNLFGSWFVINLCLAFEVIGITHFSWVLTAFVRFLFGLRVGETFVIEDESDRERAKALAALGPEFRKLNVYQKLDANKLTGFLAPDKLNVKIQTADLLESACSFSIPEVDNSAWMRDPSVQDTFSAWGKEDVKPGRLPTPEDIAEFLIENGRKVPRYLLPKSHPEYIPPHMIVMELLREEEEEEKKEEKKSDANLA